MRTRIDPYMGWTDRGVDGALPPAIPRSDKRREQIGMDATIQQNGTAIPSHPGMVPKVKATAAEEHDALLYRIKHGHRRRLRRGRGTRCPCG